MKQLLALITLFIALINISAYSQTSNQSNTKQQQSQIILKPKFLGADLVFALNALNTIEITGAEVDNFLACKNFLKESVQKIQESKKTINDTIVVDLNFEIAKKLFDFLERAKFTGAQAEQYKRFLEAILEATKPYRKQ